MCGIQTEQLTFNYGCIQNIKSLPFVHFFLFQYGETFFNLFFLSFSDNGKIIKTVNAESADSNKKVTSVVIEEIEVLTKMEPIRNLEIIRTMQYGKYKLT